MGKEQPVISVWEQWFNRLQTLNEQNDPLVFGSNYQQTIDYLSREGELNQHYYTRLATMLAHTIATPVIVVLDKTTKDISIIHATIRSQKERLLLQYLKRTSQIIDGAWSGSRQLPKREPFILNRVSYDRVYQFSLPATNRTVSLLLFYNQTLPPDVERFLRTLAIIAATRQREEIELAGRQSAEKRFDSLFHQFSEGIVITNKELEVELWNRPMQQLTGFAPQFAKGRHYRELLLRTDEPDWLRKIISEREQPTYSNQFYQEFEIKTKQLNNAWLAVTGVIFRDSEGQISQVLMTFRDISKEKQLEKKKSEFISIATHELRTPITAIKGYISLMEKLPLDKQAERYLLQAKKANERLIQLSEELLQVIRLDEGRSKIALRPVSVKNICEKVAFEFKQKASQKELSLSFIKSFAGSTVILSDRTKLEQVVANLVDNAIKYTLNGFVELTVGQEISRLNGEKLVVIQVRDSGSGIPKTELTNIFEKFHRTDSARLSKETGAGLGLYIVKTFIDNLGGTVHVTSKENHGSIFTVKFPALEAKRRKTRSNDAKSTVS